MTFSDKLLGTLSEDLRILASQVLALGEILMHYENDGAPSLDMKEVWSGYGSLIREIGERLDEWRIKIEDSRYTKPRGNKDE